MRVIYLARYKEGIESYKRFMLSLGRNDVPLFIVYKGFPDIETTYYDWHPHNRGIDVSSIMMSDKSGYDLDAYREAAKCITEEYILCCNSHTEFLNTTWYDDFQRYIPNYSLLGATGSWESFQKKWWSRILFPSWPNPHIRTNVFAMRTAELLAIWPKQFYTKWHCRLFESGYNSLTRQILRHGGQVGVLTKMGWAAHWTVWAYNGTFRNNSQSALLAHDNQTRAFKREPANLSQLTWELQ